MFSTKEFKLDKSIIVSYKFIYTMNVKKRIFALLTLVSFLFCFSGFSSGEYSRSKSSETDTLVIKARLIEIPGTFPPNDLYNYVYVMKYRVLKVVKGSYHEREILVGQYNPLIPRKKIDDKMAKHVSGDVEEFKEGDKHKLKLITPISKVWNKAIEDEYFNTKLTKYYALKTIDIK